MASNPIKSIDIVVQADMNYERILTAEKQLRFATSTSLTKIAQRGQAKAIQNIKKAFTTRAPWYNPKRAYGIKVIPSRVNGPTALESVVWTAADWLVSHETEGGEDKKLSGKPGQAGIVPRTFAIPSDMSFGSAALSHVGPKRTAGGAVSKGAKPARLVAVKRRPAFFVRAKSGIVLLLQRLAKGAEPVVRYVMPKKVKIKEEKTINPAVEVVVQFQFDKVFDEEFQKALKSARTTK